MGRPRKSFKQSGSTARLSHKTKNELKMMLHPHESIDQRVKMLIVFFKMQGGSELDQQIVQLQETSRYNLQEAIKYRNLYETLLKEKQSYQMTLV